MKMKWFRRILAGVVSAVMCCSMLAGCGKGVEQTNTELNIHVSEKSYGTLQYALELYQMKYPDVQVNVKMIAEDADDVYYDNLKSSLMTGRNVSDLLVVDSTFTAHSDIYKIEQTGAFIDLNPLFSEDPEYDASAYNTAVIKGLEFDGKQYIYPIAFTLPYIASTEENLAELGITAEEFQSLTFSGFFALVKEKQEELGLSVNEIVSGALNTDVDGISQIYPNWYYPNVVNYANNSYALDVEQMTELMANMDVLNQSTTEKWDVDGYMVAMPRTNELMLRTYAHNKLQLGDNPIVTCLRDKNNQINAYVWLAAAILQLSPNQQNAYNFLKILLSDEIQNFKFDKTGVQFTGVGTAVLMGGKYLWYDKMFGGKEYDAVRNADFAYREEVSGSFLYSEWSKLIMEQAEEYYKGNCSAEQAVESVEKKLKIYVSE